MSVRAHLFPSGNLVVVPDTGGVGLPTGLAGDVSTLGDEQGSADAGALLVKLDDKVGRDVCGIGTVASLGSQHHSVFKSDITNLNRLEESGCRHGCSYALEL